MVLIPTFIVPREYREGPTDAPCPWFSASSDAQIPGPMLWLGSVGSKGWAEVLVLSLELVNNSLLLKPKDKVKALVTQSCPTLCDSMDYSLPGSLSMEFSRQEYWSG